MSRMHEWSWHIWMRHNTHNRRDLRVVVCMTELRQQKDVGGQIRHSKMYEQVLNWLVIVEKDGGRFLKKKHTYRDHQQRFHFDFRSLSLSLWFWSMMQNLFLFLSLYQFLSVFRECACVLSFYVIWRLPKGPDFWNIPSSCYQICAALVPFARIEIAATLQNFWNGDDSFNVVVVALLFVLTL